MPVLPEYRLDGKVAFLAGEGDGITPTLAGALAEAGAKVFILGPHQPVVEGAMMEVAKLGGQSLGLFGEPSDPTSVERALEAFLPIWGRVDILVNNSRTSFGKPFDQVTLEEWDEMMRRNVGAAYLLANRVGREMTARGGGRIVNIISGLAERGLWNSTAFCASQGAVLQLTRGLALEWARKGVRVNAVGLGWLEGDDRSNAENGGDPLLRYIPMKRRGLAEEIAPLVVYLASDACNFTTGQPIYLDGGLLAHP